MAYIANTPDDIRVMLGAIGLDSLEQLFERIPAEYRLNRPLQIPLAMTELELTSEVQGRLSKNQGADLRVCFLGGGCYDHFIPAVVDNLASRGEFYTSYTPYQPEASQGTLQATFEYQTLITQLTGMDVSNASLYDGGSATAEAVLMALTITRRFGRVVVAESVHPEYRQVLATYLAQMEPELVTSPCTRRPGRGRCRFAKPSPTRPRPWSSSIPTVFGQLEDVRSIVAAAQARGALAIVIVDPISLGLLNRPERLWGRHRGRGRAVPRQRPVVRRSLPGDHGLPRGLCAEDARPDRRPDDRPEREAVLGA